MDPALYREAVTQVRMSGVDVLLNLTTGVGGNFAPGESDPRRPGDGTTLSEPARRIVHVLELKPELCSLDVGSMNKSERTVFINTPGQLRAMARAFLKRASSPSLRCSRRATR